jgi:hypothetical protein
MCLGQDSTPSRGGTGLLVPRLVPFHGRETRPERHPLFKGDLGGFRGIYTPQPELLDFSDIL